MLGGAKGGRGEGVGVEQKIHFCREREKPRLHRPGTDPLRTPCRLQGSKRGGGGESRRGSVRELKIFVADWKVKNFDFSSSRAEQGDWGWITRLFVHCENSGY